MQKQKEQKPLVEGREAHKLTIRQKRFVHALPGAKNYTDAARKAGYSIKNPRTLGSALMSRPLVQEAVKAELERVNKEAEVNAVVLVAQLKSNMINAATDKQYSASNGAVDLLGKHIGFYAQDNAQKADATRKLLDLLE